MCLLGLSLPLAWKKKESCVNRTFHHSRSVTCALCGSQSPRVTRSWDFESDSSTSKSHDFRSYSTKTILRMSETTSVQKHMYMHRRMQLPDPMDLTIEPSQDFSLSIPTCTVQNPCPMQPHVTQNVTKHSTKTPDH